MDKGWFSAFRDDFAPTRYESSQAPSSVNIKVTLLFSVFVVPYLAFLIILPGLRVKRIISFITMTIQLGTGAMLFGSVYLPYWNVGDAHIVSQFRAHSTERHESLLGVRVGLGSVNITMKYVRTFRAHSTERHESLLGVRVGLGSVNITMKYVRTVGDVHKRYDGLYFNEHYDITGISSMASELQQAFHNGLPYPMLKVLEYFSLNQGSFDWGRHYRVAGHYTNALSSVPWPPNSSRPSTTGYRTRCSRSWSTSA
uniref:DUOXA-like protein C06E1.3 n=1 Tax=Steinernema glaseri TaxID=37863 RepID=A0A1I7YWJ5_9BILA